MQSKFLLSISAVVAIAAFIAIATIAVCASGQTTNPKARCLVFYMDGCAPCKSLHNTIEKTLAPNGWTVGANSDFEFVNVKDKRNSSVDKYRKGNGWSCPTMVVIDSKGKELARHVGELPAEKIVELINGFRK